MSENEREGWHPEAYPQRETPLFRMISLFLSQAQDSVNIPFPKLMMHTVSLAIGEATDQDELHNLQVGMAKYIRNALRPEIRKMKRQEAPYDSWDPDDIEDIIGRFEDLDKYIKVCSLVGVSCKPSWKGAEATYVFSGRTAERNPEKDDEKITFGASDPNLTIEVLAKDLEMGNKMARANEQCKNNCQIGHALDEVQGLAFELGVITVGDALEVESRAPTREDVKRRRETRHGSAVEES